MQLKHNLSKAFFILFILSGTLFLRPEGTGITIDFSERFRTVSWDNPITLDPAKEDESTFIRHRTSLGVNWSFSKNAELYFKATNEFRIYFNPEKDFNIHEIFVDNLYLKLKNLFSLPVILTMGRQNIILGEGFIVLDGSTYDGSRSIFFDAVRADIHLKNKNRLSIFSLCSQRTDEFLPILNSRNQLLNQAEIRGTGLYYQGNAGKFTPDIYFLKKKTDIDGNKSWNLSVNTFGTRLSWAIVPGLSLTAEGALQHGKYYGEKVRALGGHFHLDRKLRGKPFRQFTIGGILLSGNKPGDPAIRSWDPPFSRWPKWSESYIYTLINEGGIAYWTNLSSLYVNLITKVFKKGVLSTTLNLFGALEKNTATDFPGGEGRFRGILLINRLNFSLSKHFSGHLLWEHFRPGNFYFSGSHNYNWVRLEIMYRVKSGR